MKPQLIIRLLLFLVVLAAHAHCVASHAAELSALVKLSRYEAPSNDDSQPYQDHSGCICQGALVNESGVTVLDQEEAIQWTSCTNHAVMSNCFFALNASHKCNQFSEPTVLFGRASALALLQSFQI
jgi:hypothetical protein